MNDLIDELAAFLRACWDETAQAAHDATGGPWWDEHPEERWGEQKDAAVASSEGTLAVLPYDKNGHLNAAHIARHDPDGILADVEAKRALLDDLLADPHTDVEDSFYSCPAAPGAVGPRAGGPCDPFECGRDERLERRLKLLVRPYRKREGFNSAWLEER
ncbi:DUF6221 family protein [Streptomyces sp. DH37]|uniref:DUF6221 family protein n=1 Tax=Streptomyces sp. DH37 TaxID=3040122 RepID=UPI0024432412|nr:DUF6221 family protein [Streptomyces sp. DH37]MDG9703769.1 DUF6221 family protein [Streptomyces sp. DH37]